MKRKKRERMQTALSQAKCAIDSLNGIEKYVRRYNECYFNPHDSSCRKCEFYWCETHDDWDDEAKVCLLDDTLHRLEIFKIRLEGLIG